MRRLGAKERNCYTFMKTYLLLTWLVWFTLQIPPTQTSGSMATTAAISIQCAVCRILSDFTQKQKEMCCNTPTAVVMLTSKESDMNTECRWQFRKDLWNCMEMGMPIYNEPNMNETPEKAFIYALASATVVHTITSACSLGELGSECGCDYSRNGLTVQGWQWGSCSDNVSYGVTFAMNFLDDREIEVDPRNDTAVDNAAVHLHNNAVGRNVVMDNMALSCRCHGISGSCAVRTCWRELPTYYQVGDILKQKYDDAIKVSVDRNRASRLVYYDPVRSTHYIPSENSLVYLQETANYCLSEQNFTLNRECLPQAMLDAQRRGEVKVSSVEQYFPPCESFCCNGEYVEKTIVRTETCNCRFVWCCDVICQTCVVNTTKYLCTG